MNKSNVKVAIVLIILFAIFFVLCYLFQGEDVGTGKYVIVNGYNVYEYKNKSWKKLFNAKIEDTKFKIYTGYDYRGTYIVTLSDMFYFFDDNTKSYSFDEAYIGFYYDMNIDLIPYKVDNENNSDMENVSKYLKTKGISYNGKYSVFNKYVVDLNNDNNNDYVYVISNQLYGNNPFYIIFAKVGSKYIDIDYSTDEKITFYDLKWVLSTNNYNYNDIILIDNGSEFGGSYLFRYSKDNKYYRVGR